MTHERAAAGLDLVTTSLAVIDAGQDPCGSFVAGPTFSQYGYAWLRDGAFVAEALDLVGRLERSARFHRWVSEVVLRSAEGLERARAIARGGGIPTAADYLHCRFLLDGRVPDDDWPTFQLDGPGIWLWSLAHHARCGGTVDADARRAVRLAARYVAELWRTPCYDAWEEYEEHVHTSTLAAIRAGLDAAVEIDPDLGADEVVAAARSGIADGFARTGGAWTKWRGNGEVDGSLLWMAAPYRSVAPDEPTFATTFARIERELTSDDVGVHRYRSDTYYGGGAWPVLTSAYGRVLLRRDGPGDVDRARAALRWIEAQADDAGHLPEQIADHALAPGRIDEWRERWGESARPLLWSHAAYLALHVELERRVGATPGGA